MAGAKPEHPDRAERLAGELRANLKKRKARAKALKSSRGYDGDSASPAAEKPSSNG